MAEEGGINDPFVIQAERVIEGRVGFVVLPLVLERQFLCDVRICLFFHLFPTRRSPGSSSEQFLSGLDASFQVGLGFGRKGGHKGLSGTAKSFGCTGQLVSA